MRTVFTKCLAAFALILLGAGGVNAQKLSGSYTIDPSGSGSTNYTSISAAASALMSNGVSGPVTFTIASGTYTGQVSLSKALSGVSATNTVTFKGKTGNRKDVTISNTGTYTLYMPAVDYVTFENVSIRHGGTYGIYLNSNADHNTFDNVRVTFTGSGTGYNIYNYRSEFNTFNDCLVENGYMGIYNYGWNTSNLQEGTTITNSQFYHQTYYGIYSYYGAGLVMDNIELDSFSGNYPMYIMYNNSTTLSNSRIIAPTISGYMYWYYNNYQGTTKDTSHVFNNMIQVGGGSYAIYGYYLTRNKWYNNSLDFNGSSYGAYFYYANQNEFYNNNWHATGGTYGIYMYFPTSGYTNKMDNNNLDWNGGSYWGVISQYAFTSLSQQVSTISTMNANSIDVDPAFESQKDGDLRSYSPDLNNAGIKANWITGAKDIDGNDRPATGDTKFDIGCNEFFLSPNDVDVKGLISPASVNPSGNNTITANFKNTGSATLTSQTVEYQYSVDSGKTWSKGISGTISSLAPGKSYDVELTKTWNPGRTGDFRIGVRMSKQVTKDPDAKDEIFVDVCSGMAGTYTVGRPSSDFATLADALKKLDCGIAGNIRLVLAGGTSSKPQATYSQLKFNGLNGTANATLTIDGQHPDSVKIAYTGSAFEGAIELNDCSYLNFTNMTVSHGSGGTAGAHVWNGSHHNSVTNCIIDGSNSSNSSNIGIALTGSSYSSATVTNFNTFENNIIKGQYYAINNYSSGGNTSASNGNVFKDNLITAYYYYGYRSYYAYGNTVDGNKIVNPRYSYAYPFYHYYCSKSDIKNNEIGDYYAYSIYNYRENYYSSKDTSYFINNLVNGTSSYTSSTYGYGTYIYYGANIKFWHNTMMYDQATPPTSASGSSVGAALKAFYGTNWDIQNNIFITPMAVTGAAPVFLYNMGIDKMEGNNFVHPNGIVANIGYTNLSSIAALQSAFAGQNTRAYAEPVYFAGSSDYHLSTTKPNLRGTNIGVGSDIDGDGRCLFAPSIGADESGYPVPKTRAFFAVNDTVFINAATQFSNQAKAIDPLVHSWFIDGTFVGSPVDLEYRFTATGSYEVKLISEGCGGVDTFEKTVYVKIPTSAPKADFLASKKVVDVNETVTFKNITTNGPDSFYWRIDSYFVYGQYGLPEVSHNFVDNTDSNSTDPSIEFTNPGTFTVSLYAFNLRGGDSAIKTNLITVRQTIDMCGFNTSTSKHQGKLFDEGGPTGGYAANRKLCDYLIDPCTDEIKLTINEFNLAAGSFLRIYDGIDNTGKPLHAYDPAFSQGLTGDMTQMSNFKTTFTTTSGEVYFEFTSSSATASGFEILWDANVINPTTPSISLTSVDTVCAETPFVISNSTTGQDVDYQWYMDTTTINFFNGPDYISEDVTHQYDFAGTYYVKMVASNCGGADSSIFPIVVVAPTSAPKPAFSVNNKRPAIGDVVTLTDASTSGAHPCISEWLWKISPSTYSFVSGYDKNSQNPQVLFSDTGCYDISLTVSNSFGDSTYTMKCGVFSISTCIPTVKITGTNVGISRVVIGSIDNRSTINADGYENFVNSASTNLEIGATYDITIERPTSGSTKMNRAVWVDYNQDGAFDNSELVASSKADNNTTWTGSFTIPSSATKGSARLRVGANLGNFKQYGCGPNQFGEFEDYRVFITEDRQAPVIVFVGAQDTSIEQCASWTDPGASGLDNVDGVVSLTSTLSGVDMTTAGTYTIVYKAEDKSGNEGTGTRTVRVTADATAPVITLKGTATMDVEVKGTYTDPGFTASDNCGKVDAADVVVTGTVDETTLGTYPITYYLEDDDNNTVTVTRTVNVVDTEAPTVTLLGNANDTVEVFGTYTEMGIDPVDNYYTNLTYKVTGTVDVTTLGTYELKYTSTDGSGNTSTELTRTVYVVDTEAPKVRLAYGPDTTITIDVWSKYTPEYVDIDDNYYSESSIRSTLVEGGSYVTTFGTGAASELGNFTYTYTLTDGSGNETTVTRNIVVADREAPELTFNDGSTIVITRWTVFDPLTDVSITPSDNFAAEKDLTITVKSNSVDKNSTGLYQVEYNVEDPSGNVGTYTLNVAVVDDITTDISSAEMSADIYPNPTNGVLNINVDLAGADRARVSIINSLGQEVMVIAEQATTNINTTVDLSNLSAGVYNVQIVSSNQRMVKKVTVTE